MGHKAEYPFIFKENMDIYLQKLNSYIYSMFGNIKVDILVSGGSALIIGHNFRQCTEDVDVFIRSGVDITPCIDAVSRDFSIPDDWMNDDFTKSPSFSKNLTYSADFVKSYGCLDIYKVCDLDLVCMKLVAFRDKDTRDLASLLKDCPYITQGMISNELQFLYGENILMKMKQDAINFVRYNVRRY